MIKGTLYPNESSTVTDARSGVSIRQITSHPSIHHHPFYYIPAFDDAMRHLVFVSHRTGTPQLFLEERASGKLIQLTNRPDLNEWSIHPSYDGRFVYFTAGCAAWRVSTGDFGEDCLVDFGDVPMIPSGMVGDAMGTTSLSTDDRWWAVPVKTGDTAGLYIIDTGTAHCESILERDTIGHPQFHPDDSSLLHYGGPYHSRVWIIRRDGSDNRLVYQRDASNKEWIVHESWVPGKREILTANWPHGVIGINVDTGNVRTVTSFPAWHPMINRQGTLIVADTKNPDRGLFVFAPEDGQETPRFVCLSESSNAGDHWITDHCPYDDGPVDVYAPQHTHPHPAFSSDGKRFIFTSDKSGHSQLYEVECPLQ